MAKESPSLPSYPMNGELFGYGIIIINTFNHIPHQTRQGTDRELESFKQLFLSIGLEVFIFEDLSKNEILTELQMISKDDKLKEHSLIAIAIRLYSRLSLARTPVGRRNLFPFSGIRTIRCH